MGEDECIDRIAGPRCVLVDGRVGADDRLVGPALEPIALGQTLDLMLRRDLDRYVLAPGRAGLDPRGQYRQLFPRQLALGRHALVLGLVRDHAQEARGVRPLEIDRRPTLTALVNPLEGGQPQPGLHVLARAVALEATLLEDRKDLLLEEGVVDLLGRIVRVLGLRGEQSPPPGQRLDACRG